MNVANFDEYKDLSDYFYEYIQLKKNDKFYYIFNKFSRLKNDELIKPYEVDKN